MGSITAPLLFFLVSLCAGPLLAPLGSAQREQRQDPRLSEKREQDQRRRAAESRRDLERELSRPFDRWLNEEVAWIINDEERQAFKRLQNAEEREQFVELFWSRRDPTPDTQENEYKEEHYRRVAYANEHFASGIPGWRSDRGRIYIT